MTVHVVCSHLVTIQLAPNLMYIHNYALTSLSILSCYRRCQSAGVRLALGPQETVHEMAIVSYTHALQSRERVGSESTLISVMG